jgi:hypothetical protein
LLLRQVTHTALHRHSWVRAGAERASLLRQRCGCFGAACARCIAKRQPQMGQRMERDGLLKLRKVSYSHRQPVQGRGAAKKAHGRRGKVVRERGCVRLIAAAALQRRDGGYEAGAAAAAVAVVLAGLADGSSFFSSSSSCSVRAHIDCA